MMKTAIVYKSYHHNNTEKVAKEMAQVLGADLKRVGEFNPSELAGYDLIGFGSGIYMSRHHKTLLTLVASLPTSSKKSFIFSTSGMVHAEPRPNCHKSLRNALQQKNFEVIDEFNCPGLDTVIFVRLIHLGKAVNPGRPNEEDLKRAQEFAQDLKKKA